MLLQELKATGELDDTLIVISGDHGAAGFGHGKCTLYDFGTSVSLAIRWGGARGGRVVDDLVSLTDLAPTFLELAGVAVPPAMTGRSLVNVLTSDKSGQVDPERNRVFFGRERPSRTPAPAICPTLGAPPFARPTCSISSTSSRTDTRWAIRRDSTAPTLPRRHRSPRTPGSPLPTRMPARRRPGSSLGAITRNGGHLYLRAYGKRPRAELYDLKTDPHEVHNVADNARYARPAPTWSAASFTELERTGNRARIDDGRFYKNASHGRSGRRGNAGKGQGKSESQGQTE